MSEIDWSTSAVKVLVQQYEKRPELWDRHHSLYRATTTKMQAWASIAEIFSCDVTDLRKKFNSLLASYRRERAKVKESGRSTWFLYGHMAFLPGYIPSQDTPDAEDLAQDEELATDNYEQIETIYQYEMDSDATHISEEQEQHEIIIKPEPNESYKKYSNSNGQRKRRIGLKRLRPERRLNMPGEASKAYVDSRILDVQRMMRSDVRKKDDCDSYGEYIASTLRKHDNKTQCMIKQAINNILFEQEMNKYENPLETEMVAEILDPSDE